MLSMKAQNKQGDSIMKTACLTFSCPSCNTNYEIFLKSSPNVMILNCPTCKKCVSLYNGKITEVNETLINKLQHAKTDKDIKKIFDNIEQKQYIKYNIEKQQMDHEITNDDIINLKINLNNCNTVEELLAVI
jgi:hypothetical protein